MAILLPNISRILSENGNLLDPSLLKPEVATDVIDIYGNQSLMGIMNFLGKSVPVNQSTYYWVEDGFIHSVITTNGGTAGGAGAAVTLTITTGTSNYRNLGVDSWPDVGDQIYLPKQGINAFIIAKNTGTANAHTISVAPSDPAITLIVASGEEISLVGHEQPEGGDTNGSKMHVPYKKSNNTFIHTANFQVTGSGMTLENIASYQNVDGKRTKVEVSKQINDLYKRYKNEVMFKMLIDTPVTNPVVTNALGAVKGFRALLPDIEANGGLVNFTAGAMTLTDINLGNDNIIANRGPKEVWQLEANKFSQEYDRVVKDTFPNGGIVYGSFNGDKELAINYGFNSFKNGSITYHRMGMDYFNHTQLLGTSLSRFKNYAFCIPQSTVRDPETNKDMPALSIRYKAGEIADRKEQFLITGGSPGVPRYTESNDRAKYTYRGDQSLQAGKINQFVAFKG